MAQVMDSITPLEARAGLYSALALGLDYPSDNDDWDLLVASLRSASERLDHGNGLGAAVGNLNQAIVDAHASSIMPAEEHTFLFARQSPCPPYESAYIDSGRGHSLADVAGFYRAFGFQIAPAAHQLPDHIGTQLEFMAVLCAKEAYALQHNLAEQAEICRDARRTFLLEHLGFWTAIFVERVKSTARLPLYPALAELVRAVLKHEAHELKIELPQLPEFEQPTAETDDASEIQCAA